jgi:cytochrome c553
MTRIQSGLFTVVLVVCAASVVAQQQPAPAPAAPIPAGLPEWAYEFPAPGEPTAPSVLPADDNAIVKLPGVERTLPRGLMRGAPEIADWHPEDHRGPLPAIVKIGRVKEGVRPCGFCHLADGTGRGENATVNGLPVAYFIQQMEDFKNGLRHSAHPGKTNTNNMIGFAKGATVEEVRAAAEYFAAQPYPKRIKVIESRTAPKVILQDGLHMPVVGEGAGMEPLGNHIVEVPDNNLQAAARDTRVTWTAYVPAGSVNKGKALVARHQCATCHGASLEGLGPVPPLAGRSPSYATRQLFDIKVGTRHGLWSELMKPVVEKMTAEDMLNASVYIASLAPQPGRAGAGTR